MNPTLELIEARRSTRAYSDEPISRSERDAILNACFRAPTAGNMMLYSIIEVTEQSLKERLAVTCDDQPFIAKAPLVLVFVADLQKWTDLFDASLTKALGDASSRRSPGMGDLMLAAADAIIAAQNAVIAAESLGIGSCYIGDILEMGEEHAELFDLPAYTMPVAMLCLGHPTAKREPVGRYTHNVVHENRYRRVPPQDLPRLADGLQQLHAPHGNRDGVVDYPHAIRAKVCFGVHG